MKNMKNKPVVLLGAAVCLLPCLFGLILYKDLPDRLPIHWNMAGEADNFAPKPFAVFGLPVILTLFHLICHIGASADKRRANYSKALEAMTYWLIPALSLILCPMTLLASKGVDVRIEVIVPCLIGLMLVFIGNYLPKCKPNSTMGIKIPWTLKNEENWNKTHRLAGKLWIIGGIVSIICTFCGYPLLLFAAVAVVVAVPVIYSFALSRSQRDTNAGSGNA
ncbi:MAG: SdpI family protein [Oscillospiraceae bacterium]|nr:SdpI family protein [Oscillospiraceae bacterium]